MLLRKPLGGFSVNDIIEIKRYAFRIRKGIVDGLSSKGGGHVGGTLDLAEVLAVLYGKVMNVDPKNPNWSDRDYLVCSKGHAGPALYSALAIKGYFPYEWLKTLNRPGTRLPGHCDRNKVPGVDATTGSLGQGLSIACGLALASKISGSDQKTFCILGDGELAEGQNWEAAQFAAHYQLGRLTAFLDWNKKQIDGTNDEVMKLGDVSKKFESFGWQTCLVNGSDVESILLAIENSRKYETKPSLIVLDTIKGAGIKCIESMEANHCIGVSTALAERVYAELKEVADSLGMEDLEWN